MDDTESPRSEDERSQTRFSTPVSDLDDHRRQPVSAGRADTFGGYSKSGSRRDTVQSGSNGVRPDLLHVSAGLGEAGPISKDFEQAIIDDDRSTSGEPNADCQEGVSPSATRFAVPRRNQHPPNRSRESSTSSRSTSPANSVDAFADPRRRERANTVNSTRPSDVDLGLQRTVSGGTHHRRPSLGSARHLGSHDDRASYHNPIEDDVCYPQPEESFKKDRHRIDYEELDELVAEIARDKTPLTEHFGRKHSFSTQGDRARVFGDVRKNRPEVPQIFTQDGDLVNMNSEIAIDSDSVLNEKCEPCVEVQHRDRRPSIADPNRFGFFSSELQQTIHASTFGGLLAPGEDFRDLFQLPADGGVWWLDVLNPSHQELDGFHHGFGIHPLTIEDIKTQEVREKVELFKQYYFVCFRSFFQMDRTSEDYMEPLNVYMVVFREGILTFTYTPSPHASSVYKRIGRLRDYVALTADWICYALIDNIVDSYGPPITSIEVETDTIEDQVFVARTDDFAPLLRQIGECRKKVMSLMRLLGGKADVIKGFAKRCNEEYTVTPRGEIGLYLGDIQDHVVTMMSNLGHFEKMLSRSHSNYLAQLSVDNIAQGNKANDNLSKITLVATILVPLNLITGLFGMNVNVPGKDTTGLGWWFGILGVIIAIVVVALGIAKKYRFI
ncbi:MAG: Mg(2+) transporter [Heterodermia speciosa]|uniref:Mg(2+) transporter n=1 Tax=Heterodermia speciosa TaxID=116794 RepID=A0A8H3IB53_9LECA|nr:MAG: Mg(2+) transporter [Heterodermia speciosa]